MNEQNMGRVGCMPCIHATKDEIYEIARRFPEEMDRLRKWEKLVSRVAKRRCSTFFDARTAQRFLGGDKITSENLHDVTPETHGVDTAIAWSQSKRGGKQGDIIARSIDDEAPLCSSKYGLCE